MAIQICCHVCPCLPQKQITTLMFDCLIQKILMYLIGASGLKSRLAEPLSSSSCRIEDLNPELDFERGDNELRTDSFTTNEEADRVWHVIQKERMKRKSTNEVEPQRRCTIADKTPLVQPSQVISGQWEPGLILHACPITEEGRTFYVCSAR